MKMELSCHPVYTSCLRNSDSSGYESIHLCKSLDSYHKMFSTDSATYEEISDIQVPSAKAISHQKILKSLNKKPACEMKTKEAIPLNRPNKQMKMVSLQKRLQYVPASHNSAMLEIKDEDSIGKTTFQDYRGQLKLQIKSEKASLVVHISQAKDLPISVNDTFVQISMIDELHETMACNTSIHHNSQNPVYNEHFTYELIEEEDSNKRLLVSVWNYEKATQEGILLGCMSFGILNLLDKKNKVKGWYYILGENLGERKHMEVRVKKKISNKNCPAEKKINQLELDGRYCTLSKHRNESMYSRLANNQTDQMKQANDPFTELIKSKQMSSHRVSIQKKSNSYGLTLFDGCPAKVSHVIQGSAAQVAGIKAGDHMISINDQLVEKMYSNTVAKILQHSSGKVTVDILRECQDTVKLCPALALDYDPYNELSMYTEAMTTLPSGSHYSYTSANYF